MRKITKLLLSQRRNIQNLSALVILNFLAAGLFFITQVKIANVLGKEQFGLLAYGIALGIYGQTLVRYGMDRTLVRDLIHHPERFSELVVASLLLRGILMGVIFIVLFGWKILWQPTDLSWPVIAIAMAYTLKSLDLQPAYDAWHCMARHAVYNMIQRGLYFAIIWAVALTDTRYISMTFIGLVMLFTELFYLILQQNWAFRRIDFGTVKPAFSAMVADMYRSNCKIWLATVAGLSFGTLNQIILKHYSGSGELGSYAASWQIVAAAMLLLTQVSRVGSPALARVTCSEIDGVRRNRFILKYSCIMTATALPIAIPLVLFPGVIINAIFEPEYASSLSVLQVMGVYIFIFSLGLVASQYVVSVKMERTYLASVILGGCLSIILCLELIPRMGSLGAALALVIAHGISMGIYWVAMVWHSHQTFVSKW
jgi:O-antigen/teichoic acid export membrane protein